MADRNTYRVVNVAQTLLQSFPGGSSGDTVRVSIYDVTDGALDVDGASMTNVHGNNWKYSWTPSQTNVYEIDYHNVTLDVHYYEYVSVTGVVVGAPSGTMDGSTLSVLRKAFLIQIDNYNSGDLTGDNSSGDQANKAINKALQKIYSLIKDSKYLESYPSTSLASTVSQEYIELSAISNLDEIVKITDRTNNIELVNLPYWRFRQLYVDPTEQTGTPIVYSRLFNRIYLGPRPTAAITYLTDFMKRYAELSDDADQALIPSKYNYWIYSEAEVEWYKMQDPYDIPAIVISERDKNREIAMQDVFSKFDEIMVADSHFGQLTQRNYGYDRPVG